MFAAILPFPISDNCFKNCSADSSFKNATCISVVNWSEFFCIFDYLRHVLYSLGQSSWSWNNKHCLSKYSANKIIALPNGVWLLHKTSVLCKAYKKNYVPLCIDCIRSTNNLEKKSLHWFSTSRKSKTFSQFLRVGNFLSPIVYNFHQI